MALRPSAVKRSDKVVAFATHTALEDRERPRLIEDSGECSFLDNVSVKVRNRSPL